MVQVTTNIIANGIFTLYRDRVVDDVDELMSWLIKEPSSKSGGTLHELCYEVLKEYSTPTIKKSWGSFIYKLKNETAIITKTLQTRIEKSGIKKKKKNEENGITQNNRSNAELNVALHKQVSPPQSLFTHKIQPLNSSSQIIECKSTIKPIEKYNFINSSNEFVDNLFINKNSIYVQDPSSSLDIAGDNNNSISELTVDSNLSTISKKNTNKPYLNHVILTSTPKLSSINSQKFTYDRPTNLQFNDMTSISTIKTNSPLTINTNDRKTQNLVELNNLETKTSETKEVGEIIVGAAFWQKWWNGRQRMAKNWTDDFETYFAKEYDCVLTFKSHKCFQPDSIKSKRKTFFYARAKCHDPLCSDFSFFVDHPIVSPFSDVKVTVKHGPLNHNPEFISRRFCKGERRQERAKKLEYIKPKELLSELVFEAPDRLMDAGNRNYSSGLNILQKISSENHCRNDLHPDFMQHLRLLRFESAERWPDELHPGYIQAISIYPFCVVMFSNLQIKYLYKLWQEKKMITIYLDATGKIPGRSPDEPDRQMLYYAGILAGLGEEGRGQLPILEFLTNRHDVTAIKYALSTLMRCIRDVTDENIISVIEVDFSLALIYAAMAEFSKKSLPDYLKWAWDFEQLCKQRNQKLDMTIIHICSSHMFNTVRRKLKKTKAGEKVCHLAKNVMSKLISSESTEDANQIFNRSVHIFCSKFRTTNINNLVNLVQEPVNCYEVKDDEDDKNEDILEKNIGKKLRHGSPFWQNFKKIYDQQMLIISEEKNKTKKEENIYFFPKFIDYLLEYILPFFPLWSSVIIRRLYIIRKCNDKFEEWYQTRDSNAPVEHWFRTVKHDFFKNQKRISCPRFIRRMEMKIKKYYRLRQWSLLTARQTRNRIGKPDKFAEQMIFYENRLQLIEKKKKRLAKENIKLRKRPTFKINKFKKNQKARTGKKSLKSKVRKEKSLYKKMPKHTKDRAWQDTVDKWFPESKKISQKRKGHNKYIIEPKYKKRLKYEPQEMIKTEQIEKKNSACEIENVSLDIENIGVNVQKKNNKIYEMYMQNNDTESNSVNNSSDSTNMELINASCNKESLFYNNFIDKYLEYPIIKESDKSHEPYGELFRENCCWESLRPNNPLCSDIINSFFKHIETIGRASKLNIISFNTCFCVNILSSKENNASQGFYNWAKKIKIKNYCVWFIPVHINNNHWTLLVVDFLKKGFIYMDSLSNEPPKSLMTGVIKFINTCTNSKKIGWDDWVVYVPQDIPKQKNNSNNCGVYVVSWPYIAVTASYNKFEDRDMTNARKGIAQILHKAPSMTAAQYKRIGNNICILTDDVCTVKDIQTPNVQLKIVKSVPFGYQSTLYYFGFLKFEIQMANRKSTRHGS